MERAVPLMWQRTTGTAPNRFPIPDVPGRNAGEVPSLVLPLHPPPFYGGVQQYGRWRVQGGLSKFPRILRNLCRQFGPGRQIDHTLATISPQLARIARRSDRKKGGRRTGPQVAIARGKMGEG